MEMAVRLMETAETAMETDGDGSGDTSPFWQGAGTETSVPRNSSVVVAELRNSSGNFADCSRVFRREASYRQRGVIRVDQGLLTTGERGQGLGHAPWWWGQPLVPLRLLFGLHPLSGKIGVSELVSSNSKNISFVAFLKHKNRRKQETGTVASCQ
jgi:hypothetical protein